MKRFCVPMLLLLIPTGCASFGGTQKPLKEYAGDIERFTELAASVAFLRDDVKEFKVPVCGAVAEAVAVLKNIDDTEATFALVRHAALNAVKNFEHPSFTPQIKQITVLVVDQILNAVYDRVEGRYGDLIDKAGTAIILGNAIATGLNNACMNAMSLSTFSVENE